MSTELVAEFHASYEESPWLTIDVHFGMEFRRPRNKGNEVLGHAGDKGAGHVKMVSVTPGKRIEGMRERAPIN